MRGSSKSLAALQAQTQGELAPGTLRRGESIDAVWQHLCEGLTALAERGETDLLQLPENGLTQRLFRELERRPGERPYFFDKEHMEDDTDGHSARVDLVANVRDRTHFEVDAISFAGGERFLALEAKRLPTQGTGREREYLAGEKGGVARFKKGAHARELKTVGLIAYVQRHDLSYWRDTINGWVDELIAASKADFPWDQEDKLQTDEMSPRLARLRSSNFRVSDGARLTMRHIWVQLASVTRSPDEDHAQVPV